MKTPVDLEINNKWVRSYRGKRNKVDPEKPYAYLVEQERSPSGDIEQVATIFLTNKECPFQCLMCDLWKNTTSVSVSPGEIPRQIEWVLGKIPDVSTIKLYNSGNFFDTNAIPAIDYPSIAELLQGYKRVVIENHPRLINENTFKFLQLLKPELEIAMGLETAHPEVLKLLNKKMTLEDFKNAAGQLQQNAIGTRAFVLLRPPFLDESEGILWAKRSIDFAFEAGVRCVTVIPTRYGNGALDHLSTMGYFSPPHLSSLEEVLDYGIELNQGNVFADLWDIHLFSDCKKCLASRKERINEMNLHQSVLPRVSCTCN